MNDLSHVLAIIRAAIPAGRASHRAGIARDACPHSDTYARAGWVEGWDAAWAAAQRGEGGRDE